MTETRPPAQEKPLDRTFALEAVRVTEAAAIAAFAQIGRGNEHDADHAAVEAMRAAFNVLPLDGAVVIGEGERDEAPMLFIGEKVGQGGLAVDIALDPLEGTTLTAKAMANALAVMAMAEPGTMLNAPDTYMGQDRHRPWLQGWPGRSGCRAGRQHQRHRQGQGRHARPHHRAGDG